MANFLFVTWDGGGNSVPAIAIAQELLGRGHRVRFLGHGSQTAAFAAAGLPFAPYPTAGGFTMGSSPVKLLQLAIGRHMRRDVLTELAARPADLVVVDFVLTGVMGALLRAGLPYAVLEHTMDGLMRKALGPLDPFIRFGGYRVLQLLEAGRPTICASLPDLDAGHGDVVHIGPVIRGVPARPASPTVLVSLSTFGFAALARTWQRVFEAIGDLPVRVIATTGPALDPAGLRVPANTELHRWLPHEDVMPNVSVVVGHGGHGTTMAALAHGIPLLVLPLDPTTDQRWIGRAVERAGVGLTLPRTAPAERIRAAVEELLRDGPQREAAARMGERARRLGGRGQGADLLEEAAASRASA